MIPPSGVLLTAMSGPDFKIESDFLARGVWPIAGVDEVGRGPLAGPVTAAAVILDPEKLPGGVNDSKALRPKQRDEAFDHIMATALAVSVSFVTAAEIDEINIRRAALAAMARAVSSLARAPAFVLVDGRDAPPLSCPCRPIIKGDATSLSIAAASIVAKVARDAMMRRLSELYPDYGFEANVGYAAPRHLEALRRIGPTPIHRFSFAPLKNA
jgi:ribonuclease HII